MQLGCLPHVLAELKSILVTPIKPRYVESIEGNEENIEKNFDDDMKSNKDDNLEDLPSEITRVMGKACTQILVTQPDEECCITYLGLLERVLSHEAFSQTDKRRFQSWKAQCQKLARDFATNRKLAGIEKGPRKYAVFLNFELDVIVYFLNFIFIFYFKKIIIPVGMTLLVV